MGEEISILQATLMQRCPACGKGKLFSGFLRIVDQCEVCHLSFQEHEKGDGPSFFVIVVLGFLITGLAAWVELAYEPPFWVHAVLWAPLTFVLAIVLLRVFKAMIIAIQYRTTTLK